MEYTSTETPDQNCYVVLHTMMKKEGPTAFVHADYRRCRKSDYCKSINI